MHPFCCAPPIPFSPIAGASSAFTPPSMPPPTPTYLTSPPACYDYPHPLLHSPSARSTPSAPMTSPPQSSAASTVCGNGFRWPSLPSVSSDFSSLRISIHDAAELRLNDIVGSGIAGILHKWVNYGCGWRPRWFFLQDGVLSYYKIHGPDRIQLHEEADKGSKLIGEVSLRRVRTLRRTGSNSLNSIQRKPIGEVHLKVATVRESRSDDRRFSIFTGTKRLHLRAETREDRAAWAEALQTVKEMFPRISNSELMAPVDNFMVSTERLRQRLQEEGVSEAAIQDSEQIMCSEFVALQGQFSLLKQKHLLLTDTLRQLETEKVDLENTLVIESQIQSKEHASASASRTDKGSEASVTESEDDNERQDIAEEETEDEDNTFFDTQDFLSSGSFKSSGSDFVRSEIDSEEEDHFGNAVIDDLDPFVNSSRFSYPFVRRRKKLPDPLEKEKGVSLWSMIKDNIGKDLTKVCLPVYFNEPLSSLQKCFEDLEYSYLLDQAYECGKQGNGLMRILNVAAFALSGYASTEGRICKPFNPLLGETYEANYLDKGVRFFSEKVSHHPMIVACHCEGTGWKLWGDSNLKSKFWGRSIQLDPVGILTLEFDDGEFFQWSKVTTSIYNLILGKLYCDHYGTMKIHGNGDYSCKLKFKEQSIIDRNPHQVHGMVQNLNGKTMATLFGKWDDSLHYVSGDPSVKAKLGAQNPSQSQSQPQPQPQLLWERSKPPKNPTRYNLTRFAITLNELTPDLKEQLPPTDSRLRPDQRRLENGDFDMANTEKLRLEQRQRQARRMQESGWKPRWFAKEQGSDTYRYIGGYWEAREKGQWDECPDIFGQIPNVQLAAD